MQAFEFSRRVHQDLEKGKHKQTSKEGIVIGDGSDAILYLIIVLRFSMEENYRYAN